VLLEQTAGKAKGKKGSVQESGSERGEDSFSTAQRAAKASAKSKTLRAKIAIFFFMNLFCSFFHF
jgi:hypothetical protein